MNLFIKTVYFLIFAGLVSCTLTESKNNNPKTPYNKLSDKLATEEAINLYNNMTVQAKTGVMIGHQDALAYGIGWKADTFRTDINDVCNEHPAVFGWDLGHIADTVNIDSVSFNRMKKWALDVYEKGGVNTYGWHSNNFLTGKSSWDTTSCIRELLPSGSLNKEYIEKLDLVADFFAELKNSKGEAIPVLFRPFHEMNGGWFWWGANSSTPNEYKELWKYTVDYLRNNRKLHNIIYIYSTDVFESKEEYLRYYPGDNYVDVLGYDDYKGLNSIENAHKSVEMLEILADLSTEKNKIYTISETGLETIPDSNWFTQVVLPTINTNTKTSGISYILFWRNGRPDHFYAPYPKHSSAQDFVDFKNDESTLFLSDMKNIYQKNI